MELVLGLGGQFHDANLALATASGGVVAVLEEERFSRKKHHQGPPDRALNEVGNTLDAASNLVLVSPFSELEDLHPGTYYCGGFSDEHRTQAHLPDLPQQHHWMNHHFAHACYARAVAGWEDVLVVTCDALGSGEAAGAFYFKGHHVQRLTTVSAAHSLGLLWERACTNLGLYEFRDGRHSSKPGILTGLAAWGVPRFAACFLNKVRLLGCRGWELSQPLEFDWDSLDFHSPDLIADWTGINWSDVPVAPGTPSADLAASLQVLTERVVVQWVDALLQECSPPALAFSGGIALNPGVSLRLERLCSSRGIPFMAPPAPSDAGSGLGAAAALLFHRGARVSLPDHFPFMGPLYGAEKVREAADEMGFPCRDWGEAASFVAAERLVEGQILPWCHGRSEHGPRALGARSLLADAGLLRTRTRLNELKSRAQFRPVAPVVLEVDRARAFKHQGSPFMNVNSMMTPWGKAHLPGAVHKDGSARLQTVPSTPMHPLYTLLREVRRLSGIGCALNTSFNRSEPLVETPYDAIGTAVRMGLPFLFFDGVEIRLT